MVMLVRQWKEAGGDVGQTMEGSGWRCWSDNGRKRVVMLVRQWKEAGGDVGQTMEGSGW